ncbi:P49 [Perigonia lusca single nucleopolyhedrovirus]|uniref:p49 n=1 Tax=Perigonia lusca single nucleopolyhedrovirus TaxID=1675865 RepID=A0A0M3N101_9ABAC|nr:P49 [Perigonia lusca single nucleopolyhedrovirus]AKN80553.1 P49 [Perigonia lusca single nucleopolyhedrovirus]
MSTLISEKLTLEPSQYKYLFLASYFRMKFDERFSSESEPFIAEYLRNNFNVLDESTLLNFVDYLTEMQLKNLVVDRSVDMFRFVKPQFKFVCTKSQVEILEFDDKVYLQPKTNVYATNFFVSDPRKYRLALYQEFSKVFDSRQFVSNNNMYTLMNGNVGYVFDDAYTDWCGVRMCNAPKVTDSMYPYRLYLIGDEMANHFIENNISFSAVIDDKRESILKNFHKGIPMFRNNYRLINSKKFRTNKPNKVFDEIKTELDTSSKYVKFIQRDYIFDAVSFPDDLLDLLNEFMTETSVYKFITKFVEPTEMSIEEDSVANRSNYYSEIVVDRYAVDKYRKINVKIETNTRYPSLRYNEPAYIFVRPDIIQIKGTLNAFYVPKERIFAILANNSLFGSKELLHFDLKLIPYTHSSPPRRLNLETYVIDSQQKLYLTRYIFGNTVPAYLLIRGDYESSFKSLHELKNPWVHNTLLKLLITTNLVEYSLQQQQHQHGRYAPTHHKRHRAIYGQ